MSDRDSILAEQEVDDEIRREQLLTIWRTYGKFIIGGAVAVVLIVAGNQYFTYQQESAERANSARLAAAIDSAFGENINLIQTLTEALPELDDGYNAIARLKIASAQVETRDFRSAIATYDALAADSSVDESLSSLARLIAAMVTSSEIGDLEDARARFSVLAVEDGIWYFTALEQLALIDLELGDNVSAIASFDQLISNRESPATIRSRATQLRSLVADDAAPLADPAQTIETEIPTDSPEKASE